MFPAHAGSAGPRPGAPNGSASDRDRIQWRGVRVSRNGFERLAVSATRRRRDTTGASTLTSDGLIPSDRVQLAVRSFVDRDAPQAARGWSVFHAARLSIEHRAMTGAHEHLVSLVVLDNAPRVRTDSVEGKKPPGDGLDHQCGISGCGILERRCLPDRHGGRRSEARARRSRRRDRRGLGRGGP